MEQRVNDMNDSFENARTEAQSKAERFKEVKTLRYNRFMACFSHLEKEIDPVYTRLSTGGNSSLGGSAWIIAGISFRIYPQKTARSRG